MVSLEVLHDAFVERLRAGDGYRPVYASSLGHDGREAIGAVSVPATLMAHEKDPLYVHFERLDALKPDQHIGQYPPDIPAYELEKARVLRSYRVDAAAPSEAPFRPTPGVVNRRYVDFPGGQILVRSAGERRKSRPLVLLHDGRGSSRVFDPLMRALGTRRPVFAPDLPDNGASDPLASRRPTVAEYADAVSEVIAALGLESPDIYAVGAGAAVALELSGQRKFRGARLILEAPDFYAPKFRRWLAGSWTPPLAPEWDGGHLNRIWLMLRDEYAFWPWFDKSAAGACAVDAPTDWSEMHARVVDIVRSLATYHRLTAAALRYDWVEALRRSRRRVTLVVTAQEPRRRHVEEAAELCHLREVSLIPAEVSAKANALLRLLRDPPAKEA
jgi:pimeloyl-ACP methyl ester carboxylesterase